MNEQATTPDASETIQLPDGEAGVDALRKLLENEQVSIEPDAETVKAKMAELSGEAEPDAAAKVPATTPDPSAVDRLKKAAEIERKAHAEKAQLSEYRQRLALQEKAIEAKEKAIAEREAKFADQEKMFSDPALFLHEMRKRIDPKQLAEWFTEEMDPSKAAEWAMRRMQAQQPKPTENEDIKALRAEMAELKAERQRQAQDAQRTTMVTQFLSSFTDETPLSAALAKKDPDEVVRRCDAIADRLREAHGGATYNQVQAELEKELSKYRDLFAPQSQPAAVPAKADRARTLMPGNSAGRSSIADLSSHKSVNEAASELKRLLGG